MKPWISIFLEINYFGKQKVCDTVQLLSGFLQCNGGKLDEAEDFKCVFVVIVC